MRLTGNSDERCTCMALYVPVLSPYEHADDCPLRAGTCQYRATNGDRPESWWDDPAQDGLWDADLSLVTEEAEVQDDLGMAYVRIERRIVLP